MCRAFPGPEYYGGSAPPGPFSGRCAYPGQRAGCPPAGNRDQAVPVFTAVRSAEEEPGCVPAASPRVRRSPSPWPPGVQSQLPRRESRRVNTGGTRRVRPRSTRLEPAAFLKDVITPVPRVLLSATLAGPAPSGGAGTSRLCQGCSRPPRHHPDQAALSFTALLRQDGGEGLSPPLEQQRLTAQSHPLADQRPQPPNALPLKLRHPRSAARRCLRSDGTGQD
jgi:hypothetical protein